MRPLVVMRQIQIRSTGLRLWESKVWISPHWEAQAEAVEARVMLVVWAVAVAEAD